MKIDYEYLRGLLLAFQNCKKPYTNIDELEENGFLYKEDSFLFHMEILYDYNFIVSRSSRSGFGYSDEDNLGPSWQQIDLRLTGLGHEFISSLNDPDVWSEICKNFKKSGIDTVKSVAIELAKSFAKKKITALLSE